MKTRPTRPKRALIQDIFDCLPMELVDRDDEQLLFHFSARELAALGRMFRLATDSVARRYTRQLKRLTRSRQQSGSTRNPPQ